MPRGSSTQATPCRRQATLLCDVLVPEVASSHRGNFLLTPPKASGVTCKNHPTTDPHRSNLWHATDNVQHTTSQQLQPLPGLCKLQGRGDTIRQGCRLLPSTLTALPRWPTSCSSTAWRPRCCRGRSV